MFYESVRSLDMQGQMPCYCNMIAQGRKRAFFLKKKKKKNLCVASPCCVERRRQHLEGEALSGHPSWLGPLLLTTHLTSWASGKYSESSLCLYFEVLRTKWNDDEGTVVNYRLHTELCSWNENTFKKILPPFFPISWAWFCSNPRDSGFVKETLSNREV